MVKKTVPPLYLSPERSVILFAFLLGSHLAAMGVMFLLPLELWLQLLVLFAIAASLIQAMCNHVLRSNSAAIKSAKWNGEGEWTLFTANGNEVAAQLQTSSYSQPWFVILNFSISRFRRRSLILLPDAVDPDLLRRLRVRLKLLGAADANV